MAKDNMISFAEVEADGLLNLRERLLNLDLQNSEFEARLRELIKSKLTEARAELVQKAREEMEADPRSAANAILLANYKKILGGNINILTAKRRGSPTSYVKPRTLRDGQRGGNRRKVSARTKQMESYGGRDRGMVLRWINKGTSARSTRYGNRGAMGASNFFDASTQIVRRVASELDELVNNEIKAYLNK